MSRNRRTLRWRRPMAVVAAAAAVVLALSGSGAAAGQSNGEADGGPAATAPDVMAPGGPLVATDALGRDLADHTRAPAPRDDRTVGVFYVLWHGSNDMREYKNVFDNNATLAEDPLAWQTPASGAFPGPGHFAYWGEPLYGYFRSDDAWVVRRDLQLLAAAQVDYLVLDASNWELYKPQAILLMRTIVELQAQGVRAPQVAFMTHSESTQNMDEIYRTFYADDAPHRYPSTWFHWDGKPLIMGADPSPAVRDFFTFRYAQWPNEPQQPGGGWDWISFDRPQRGNLDADGRLEQMAVSPAQNSGSSSIFSYTAWYGLDDPPSRSRSFHDGAEDESPGAEIAGHNFQEQWDHAIDADPETVLVLEWNEWIAGNWAARASDPLVFYDVVNTRWSRDLAPMTGGYGDNYYLQLVDNIRRYKGVAPPAGTGAERTIDLRGGFDQWRDVAPEYADYQGDTAPRDHPGVDARTYVDRTGRNDIVSAKVTRDDENVYFYARSQDRLTAESGDGWMTLYLDADADADADGATGWSGYDMRVRWHGAGDARLERFTGNGWETARESIPYRTVKNELMVAVPREALNGPDEPLRLAFKWWDHQQHDDIMDAYVSGDAAPDGRFSYLYDTGDHPGTQEQAGPPVVEPLPEPTPGWHRIEDDDRSTDYEAHVTPAASTWVTAADPESSGGTYSYLYNPGGRRDAFFRSFIRAGFEGNAVRWVAPAGPRGTEAEVFVDGLSQGVVSLYAERDEPRRTAFEVRGLPEGYHEIMVVFLAQSGTYYHDYFEYGVGAAGGDGGPAALTAGAYATASSFAPAQWFATNAGQVTDGRVTTYWRGTQASGDHVGLSFGRTVPFDRVDVVPRTASTTITSFELRLHDARGWRTVHRGGVLEAATTIDVGMTRADAVQLLVTGTTGGGPEVAELGVRSARDTAPAPPATAWEFTNGTDGWTGTGPVDGPHWSDDGTIGGDVAGPGAALLSPGDLEIDAGEFRSVLADLENRTAAREAQLRYVATTPDGRTIEGRRPFRIAADSDHTAYVVDLTDAPDWAGTIHQIGVEVAAEAGRLELGHVRLAPDHAVYAAHFTDDSLDGWTAPGATWQRDGFVEVPLDGDGDVLRSPALQADLANADTVTLRLRNDSSARQGVLRFSTSTDPEGTEHTVPFELTAHDETFTTYQVGMDAVPAWQGVLERLAVEVVGAEPDERLQIDTVRVEPFVLTSLNTKRSWTFDESAEGWGGAGHIDGFGWSDGAVGGTITGPDPQFYSSPDLWLDLTELTTVSIRMAVDTTATHGTLYFTTEAQPSFSEANSIRIPLVPGETGYVDHELDLSGVVGWTGVLRQLRLDPEEGDSSGTFLVDEIELRPATTTSAKELDR